MEELQIVDPRGPDAFDWDSFLPFKDARSAHDRR